MADVFTRIKKTLTDGLDLARNNAQNIKETAGEYGKTARLKFDIAQLKSNKKKKMNLLGESVYPFLAKNDFKGLEKHDTLRVLVDDIKLLQSEIDLSEKNLNQLLDKEPTPEFDRQQVRDQIKELEDQIESRISDLKNVKDSLDNETQSGKD